MPLGPVLRASALAVLLAPLSTFAGGFERPLSQLDYPELLVDRPLTLARGWIEFRFGGGFLVSDSGFDSDGDLVDGDFDYKVTTVDLAVRYGWTRNLTLDLTVPIVFKDFENEAGADLSASGMGDGSFGLRYQVLREEETRTSIAADIRVHYPSGSDSPGSVSDSGIADDLLLGNGVFGLEISLLGRRRVGPIAVTTEIGYTFWLPRTVSYLAGPSGEAGEIDYGDEPHGSLDLELQLPAWLPVSLAIGGSIEGRYRPEAEAGVRGFGRPVASSEGYRVATYPRVTVGIGIHADVVAGVAIPVAGKNTNAFFPLEATGPEGRLDLLLRY